MEGECSLFPPGVYFDGRTYDPDKDKKRLKRLLDRVYDFMLDGKWHSVPEIQKVVGGTESSVGARVRDLRKPQFGSHNVKPKRLKNGLWIFRLVIKEKGR